MITRLSEHPQFKESFDAFECRIDQTLGRGLDLTLRQRPQVNETNTTSQGLGGEAR